MPIAILGQCAYAGGSVLILGSVCPYWVSVPILGAVCLCWGSVPMLGQCAHIGGSVPILGQCAYIGGSVPMLKSVPTCTTVCSVHTSNKYGSLSDIEYKVDLHTHVASKRLLTFCWRRLLLLRA